jgi:hypothetical protein
MTDHGGKTMTGSAENGGVQRTSHWRIAAWAAAAFLLLLPLITGAPWTVSDFVIAGALMFGALGLYEVAVRMTGNRAYRAGVGLAIAAGVLVVWISGAVGITDSDADALYFGAIAIGIVGAFMARFRPGGMVLAMLASALATASAGVIAVAAGMVPAYNSAFEILGLSGFFAVLWVGSALLFREAARGTRDRGAV